MIQACVKTVVWIAKTTPATRLEDTIYELGYAPRCVALYQVDNNDSNSSAKRIALCRLLFEGEPSPEQRMDAAKSVLHLLLLQKECL